ncbi:TRAFAC clade GTPase domain-containing protein [Jidongwangia harbinensis]|uniref:TRAFAC clade GTPase domain-containing protein n=1 Tax=Jidongwangia harbinensis TaxID=2878561 RepID=UPI001CD9E485|nr:hypothetical protein [Jidongwangia harbinensis]MCA2211639.1 hypothetical protein [Jidongwangia harbinensis]
MKDICPYCYHEIDRRRLSFACTGNYAPGRRPCRRTVDEQRLQETGYAEESYPVFRPPAPDSLLAWWRSHRSRQAYCPFCGGRTGKQACPCCHTPLPSNFRDSFSPVIGMAGAVSTGKTVYLTVLAQQLTNVLGRRFAADVTVHGDAANAWIQRHVTAVMDKGRLPALTQQLDGRSEPLFFEWRRRAPRRSARYQSTCLSFLDTAGESLGTKRGIEELKFLAKVHAFIVLLDPFAIRGLADKMNLPEGRKPASEPLSVIQQVTEVLRMEHAVSDRLDLPIAVVFAKVDELRDVLGPQHPIFHPAPDRGIYDDEAGRRVHESVRELLLDHQADDIDRALQSNYRNYRYFAVSSLGTRPNPDNTLNPGAVRPIRVADPLVWLLAHYGLVPRTRRG